MLLESPHRSWRAVLAAVLLAIALVLAAAAAAAPAPRGTLAIVTDRTGNLEIFSINADGTNAVNLTNSPAADNFRPGHPTERASSSLAAPVSAASSG